MHPSSTCSLRDPALVTLRRFRTGVHLATCWLLGVAGFGLGASSEPDWLEVSGIYPHLAFYNEEDECGTGAVVPWAGRLWVVTYAPHAPGGSTDKLYEITPHLNLIIRPESVGGTPANRMIHRESNQLFIGPYVIDAQGRVRVIPYERMFGRPTGNARHLLDPANKVYCATMEEGVYEIEVNTLAVTRLWADEQVAEGRRANLPGYHGKGLYSGQGWLLYANNGEHGLAAQQSPDTPSGCLAAWDGSAEAWTLIRRNQFTEVTGPGGLWGNAQPETDPVWSIGWDHRSLLLMVLDKGRWRAYRMPKASHAYDGAHGWNTEWPRIRDVGEQGLLMTMHGMFWRFPRDLGRGRSAGIEPRSTYLKVIGDFCRWNDRLVFGCDDTARAEFLNQRRAKGSIAAPQSHSNLWFVDRERLDHLGPVLGRGAVWLEEDVPAGTASDPFLLAGFERRAVHLAHGGAQPVGVTMEVDRDGNGQWAKASEFLLGAGEYRWIPIREEGVWVRMRSETALEGVTAWFHYAGVDRRTQESDPMFAGLAGPEDMRVTGGVIRSRSGNERTLHFAALEMGSSGLRDVGYYELDAELKLRRVEDRGAHAWLKAQAAIPVGVLQVDEASVVFRNDDGRRYRLPMGNGAFDREGVLGPSRVDREVCTERDLFNAHGTFYELPAENAGGFAKVRPVATHNRRIVDYCSYRGLLVLSGVRLDAPKVNRHVIRSDDGRTALWVGVIDDVWRMGKPVGRGGPWKSTSVMAGEVSDPYLMTGYDRKRLVLSHDASVAVCVTVEIDVSGTGHWKTYRRFEVPPRREVYHGFPTEFQAYWVRVVADRNCRATAWFTYE